MFSQKLFRLKIVINSLLISNKLPASVYFTVQQILLGYLIVPTFEENRISMLGFFLISQFSPIEIIVFNKSFLYPVECIDFLSSNLEKCFSSDHFLCVLKNFFIMLGA